MVKFLRVIGFPVAVLTLILSLMGATKVLSTAQDDFAKGIGLVLLAVAFSATFCVIAISSLLGSTQQTQPKKAVPAPAKPAAPAKAASKTKKSEPEKTNAPKNEKKEQQPEKLRRESDKPTAQKEGPANIYIGNLEAMVSEAELREEFAVFGTVKSVRIISDRQTGKPKGYAFVEMSNIADAKLAVEDINGQVIKGQEVKVSLAKPKRRRGPRKKRS